MRATWRSVARALALGAGLNIAVAWLCAGTSARRSPRGPTIRLDILAREGDARYQEGLERGTWVACTSARTDRPAAWPHPDWTGPTDQKFTRYVGAYPGLTIDATMAYDPAACGGWSPWEAIATVRAGWPLRALEWEAQQAGGPAFTLNAPGFVVPPSMWRGGVEVPGLAPSGGPSAGGAPMASIATGASDWRRLPLRPCWPGFLANTALYGALLWSGAWSLHSGRAARRRRRGRCAACAYELAGLTVCPECGHHASTHAART